MRELDPEKIKGSKYIAMLPKSEQPWKLVTHADRIFAISPGHEPLVLYEDGWKKVMFAEADFETEAGKQFQKDIQAAARINAPDVLRSKTPKPWQMLPRSKKKRR